jgi:hypothetical protein
MLQTFFYVSECSYIFNDTSFRNAVIENNFRGFIQFQLMSG